MFRLTFIIVCIVLLSYVNGYTQTVSGYEIKKFTINSGSKSTGVSYSLKSTTGQSDANLPLVGNGFELSGGFWAAGIKPELVFYNGFE